MDLSETEIRHISWKAQINPLHEDKVKWVNEFLNINTRMEYTRIEANQK